MVFKILKWSGIGITALVMMAVLGLVTLFSLGQQRFNETYEITLPNLEIPADEESLARGKHLVNNVAHCGYCHGEDLAGNILIDKPGAEGLVVAPNLTNGVGGLGQTYKAEDWLRAIRHGVTPAGRSVLMMPSLYFHALGEQDLAAIIAYLQTIPAVNNQLPETEPGPLLYLLTGAGPLAQAMSGRLIDHTAPFEAAPPADETAAYGGYLAQIGQCAACHGAELAGGQVSRSAPIGPNLTPGGELQAWSRQDFITTLRTGQHPTGRQLDSYMPWAYFGGMSDEELGAIYLYLQEQPKLDSVLP